MGAELHARSASDTRPVSATTRIDGTFVLGPLEPGNYVLDLSATAAPLAWSVRRQLPAGITRLDIVPAACAAADAPDSRPR